MRFNEIHYYAKFKERPNRFLAKVEIETPTGTKRLVEAHVPDPGRLKELLVPEAQVILTKSTSQTRKTHYSLIGVKKGEIWVNIDSQISNRLFKEDYSFVSYFKNSIILKSEYKFGKSRIDFLMKNLDTDQKVLVEVKSVTLVENGVALFPDAPTIRGAKHVNELSEAIVTKEYQAFLVFIIKRSDAYSFKPNVKTDPYFSEMIRKAVQKGVHVCVVKYNYDPINKKELKFIGEIPFTLK